ncbi:MAG: DnaJ domain-containing protein [Rhodospirillales bacterium]|jgi:DnaJ like chaperone protein|nr:DnaJ domain-containing protein [Rhodospirillales bacterium]
MSIWGKVIGGMAGFAFGGPLGALMGAYAGHMMVDKNKQAQGVFGGGGEQAAVPGVGDRQMAFTVAVIVLGAKMAKADGHVAPEEVRAFKEVFRIPPEEMGPVGKLFNEARQDPTGFEPYASQIAGMFVRQPDVLEELLGGLFYIAKAHGGVNAAELQYLAEVAAIFGFDQHTFERIRAGHMGPNEADPYQVLGLSRDATDAEIKRTYRELIRKYHPDALIAQGMPQEFVDVANDKMAGINAAYDTIEKERGLK